MVLGWCARVLSYVCLYIAIWIIVERFEMIGGWVWVEIAFLLGFHMFAYAIGAALTFIQMRQLEEMVRQGQFEVLLVRPVNTWAYLVVSGLNLQYLGHLVLGFSLMIWALSNLDLVLSPLVIFQLVFSVVSAAMLTTAFLTMLGGSALLITRTRFFFGLFYDFWELGRYPLVIFPWPLQALLLTALPMGYTAFVPAAAVLGKEVPFWGDWASTAGMLAGPVFGGLAVLFWRFCLRKFEGVGG